MSIPPQIKPKLLVVRRDGSQSIIEGDEGRSVMELIRNHGIDEVQAMCGGGCACATCHVHVDPAFADLVPPMSQDESDLLETTSSRNANSRLSCQIPFTPALDGLRVTVAQDD